MNKLKQILAKSKPQAKVSLQKQETEKQIEKSKQRQEELLKKQEQQKNKRFKQLQEFYGGQSGSKKLKTDESSYTIPLTEEEVIKRLENLYQVGSLPGETENARYRRLLRVEKIHKQNPEMDMKTFDEDFYNKIKEKETFHELDAQYRDRMIEPKLGDDEIYRQKKIAMISEEKDKDFYTVENYAKVCDQIYLWLLKLLQEWKEKLDQKYNTEELSSNSQSVRIYSETMKEMQSFLKVLKHRGGDKQMVLSIYHIMNCCLVREYVQANDRYIQLSIGSAPWPMGVAMLSITVRKNEDKLTHVLNDEMTRKWMLGLKRLISVSQELFPNRDLLKMFHTSANSLL